MFQILCLSITVYCTRKSYNTFTMFRKRKLLIEKKYGSVCTYIYLTKTYLVLFKFTFFSGLSLFKAPPRELILFSTVKLKRAPCGCEIFTYYERIVLVTKATTPLRIRDIFILPKQLALTKLPLWIRYKSYPLVQHKPKHHIG